MKELKELVFNARQLRWLNILMSNRLQGLFLPTHVDALKKLCGQENATHEEFMQEIAEVWCVQWIHFMPQVAEH